MSLSDVTREGVFRAVEEFDRIGRASFFAVHGLAEATGYFLVIRDTHYDAQAIAGIAHGYDRPDLGPVRPVGALASARQLRRLGFHVQSPPRNPPWREEELILALELYLQGGLVDKGDPRIVQLSAELNQIRRLAVAPDESRFRNPNGVALKLANFAALDPAYEGRGMRRVGQLDAEVWRRFAGDEDALAAAVARVRSESPMSDSPAYPETEVVVTSVEALETARFDIPPSDGVEAQRREASLVRAYQLYLEGIGRRVAAHLYHVPGYTHPLRCDLFDETQGVLYEAKALPSRGNIRMAIGQLYDYRRFESAEVRLRALLPREPSADLLDLMRSSGIGSVWRSPSGFAGRD